MPRLLVVSDTLSGGSGAAAMAHVDWFSARGWDVELAAPEGHTVPRAAWRPLPVPRTARDIAGMVRATHVLRTIRARFRPDVVHCHGARCFAAARLTDGGVYVTLHGVNPVPSDPAGYGAIRRRGLVGAARLAAGAIATFPHAPAGWTFLPHASPRLAGLGRLGPPSAADPTFLWVGALDVPKRPAAFVEAMAELARAHPKARGVMAGRGPLDEMLAAQIARTGAPVRMLGQVDDLRPHLEEAWAVVLLSDSEGVPFALEEAMWAGRAVVSSPLPGATWLIGEAGRGGLLADTAADVTHALAMLADRSEAVRQGDAAAEQVRRRLGPDDPWPAVERLYSLRCRQDRPAEPSR
jgi:glycosyltransferase involved in cell wall biosynthesis